MFKSLTILALAFALSNALQAAENPIAPYHVQENPEIIVEPDQTDIFAIPLDEDAEDQQQELYKLEHPPKK